MPGQSLMGRVATLLSSSVTWPENPGSMKPAVECVSSPSRPRLDLPSSRAATSSGSVTSSYVDASTNSPGCSTNGSSDATSTSRVSSGCSSAGSMTGYLWLSNSRKYRSIRTSMLEGCTISLSYGSRTTRPPSISARMSRSESSTRTRYPRRSSRHDGLVDQLAQDAPDRQRARREHLRQKDDGDVLDRVHPEARTRRAAPRVVAHGRHHPRPGGVEDDAEPEPESHAAVRGFGEERAAEGVEVGVAGQVVPGHGGDRAWAEDPDAVQLPAAPEHLREAVVVGGGGDEAAAAREELGAGLERVAEDVVGHQPAGCERAVEPGEAAGVRGVGAGETEGGVGHAERGEDPLLEEAVERQPGRDLDDPAEHVGGDGVVPLGTGLEEERET